MPHRLSALPGGAFSDEDLVAHFRAGHVQALELLIERYQRFTRARARAYFLVGGDFDDIEQEGMIGLFKAVRDFRDDRQSSFRAFAELCVTRQIITAIKCATRQKHQPLNQYVSLSGLPVSDCVDDRPVEDLLDDHHVPDPADEVVSAERMAAMRAAMAEMLSGLEVDVLRLYVEGRSYQEISLLLGRHVKSIDNALQRIKRKLEAHLAARDAEDVAPAVA
ncbi:MAG TPA: RNA polymerase sporulation sigma factor SigH [Acidimicrobiales bacterium]|nr:RNA polymerase sporulation sigma factor SigH [Acidimicrobiales bacterium]